MMIIIIIIITVYVCALRCTLQTVAKSLQHVLDYQGDDFESVFNLTFCVEQTDMFGHTHQHALKPSGASVAVNMEDRQVRACGY